MDKQIVMRKIRYTNKLIGKPFWKTSTIYSAGVGKRMLDMKADWTTKECSDYLKFNKIPMNATNCMRMLDILKEKQAKEIETEIQIAEASVTEQ